MTACGPVYGHDLYRLKTIPIRFPGCGYYLRWYYNGWHYWFFLPGQSTFQTEGENYRTLGTRTIIIGSGQITLGECAAIRTIMNTREVEIYTDSGWANVRIEPGSAIVKNNFINGYEIELTATLGSRAISRTGYTPISKIPLIPPSYTGCEVVIGTQIWMCKNYDIDFPGSKVYNNDETNRPIYGGLYTFNQVIVNGFCPPGWHVPSQVEWQTLLTFLGLTSGGILKEIGITHWNPNIGALDTYGFAALGAGDFNRWSKTFENLFTYGFFWTATENSSSNAMMVYMSNNNDASVLETIIKDYYLPVRLIKDTPAPAPMVVPTPLVIGTQTWSAKNWDYVYPGSRVYNDNEANRAIYGGLYSYAEIMASDFCPIGWHIPTIAEWNTLIAFVGGAGVAGDKLKEIGNTHWNSPSAGTDDYGFAALPGGNFEVIYSEIGNNVSFMSATDINAGTSAGKGIFYNFGMVFDGSYCHPTGSVDTFFGSVRLIHD